MVLTSGDRRSEDGRISQVSMDLRLYDCWCLLCLWVRQFLTPCYGRRRTCIVGEAGSPNVSVTGHSQDLALLAGQRGFRICGICAAMATIRPAAEVKICFGLWAGSLHRTSMFTSPGHSANQASMSANSRGERANHDRVSLIDLLFWW